MTTSTSKLTDAEFRSRVRSRNRLTSQKRRERMEQAGYRQLLCWISGTTRDALEEEAARRGLRIGECAAALLQETLNSYSPAERLEAVSAAMDARS